MDLLEAGGDVGAEFREGLDVFFEVQAGHSVLLFVRRRVQGLSPEKGDGARFVSGGRKGGEKAAKEAALDLIPSLRDSGLRRLGGFRGKKVRLGPDFRPDLRENVVKMDSWFGPTPTREKIWEVSRLSHGQYAGE
jgi:hypothetical protein